MTERMAEPNSQALSETMIDIARYKKEGFLFFENFFDPKEISQLLSEAKDVFRNQMKKNHLDSFDPAEERAFEKGMYALFEKDFEGLVNCGRQVQHLLSLHRLGTAPRIVEVLKALGLAAPVISVRPVMYFNSKFLAKEEDYWRLGAHQDWRSSQGSLDSITVWIPLVDVNKSLGALQVIPRSHKWGLLESENVSYYGKIMEPLPEDNFTPIEARLGDALFFSSFLVHRSGTNSTGSIRWSCHFRFNNLNEPLFIDRSYPLPFSYKPQEGLITPGFPSRDLLDRLFD